MERTVREAFEEKRFADFCRRSPAEDYKCLSNYVASYSQAWKDADEYYAREIAALTAAAKYALEEIDAYRYGDTKSEAQQMLEAVLTRKEATNG